MRINTAAIGVLMAWEKPPMRSETGDELRRVVVGGLAIISRKKMPTR